MKTNSCVVLILFVLALRVTAQNFDTNGEFVQTFAGSGEQGYVDGQGQLTKFYNPSQIVADSSSNLYIWDSGNSRIRKITPGGSVSTLAGGGTDVEGWGTNVSLSFFNSIGAMAIDHANTIWLVTSGPYLLNIQTNSYVTIQNGGPGLTNLTINSGICFDSANNLYYSGGNIIWRYNPTTGISQPFAGNGTPGYVDGNGTVFPEFSSPGALACDEANNIYVNDVNNYRIRRVDQGQNITTIAGAGVYEFIPIGTNSYQFDYDSVGTNANFSSPPISQMFSDNSGNIYFTCGGCIRKMNAQTNVVTMAGNFSQTGYTNGAGNLARFSGASGACLSGGTIYIADSNNQRIRDIVFNPQSQVISSANLGLSTFPGLSITGNVGRTYQIQSSRNMSTWTTEATIILTASPYLWIDQNPIAGNKFYRALLMP
ncbi:MAG TPA: hypothetical protein VMH87_19120 [Pseudomonadales bacterium]|nr:hypothetical protein [Pseudomonadales bacterium]